MKSLLIVFVLQVPMNFALNQNQLYAGINLFSDFELAQFQNIEQQLIFERRLDSRINLILSRFQSMNPQKNQCNKQFPFQMKRFQGKIVQSLQSKCNPIDFIPLSSDPKLTLALHFLVKEDEELLLNSTQELALAWMIVQSNRQYFQSFDWNLLAISRQIRSFSEVQKLRKKTQWVSIQAL